MAAIILPRKHYTQPQGKVAVDGQVWPGRSQVFLPSLGFGGIIGGTETITLANANDPFTQTNREGRPHIWRPNTTTLPGESYTWSAGDFDVGPNASMIVLCEMMTASTQYAGCAYGGTDWGLWVGFRNADAVASYVDNPTSGAYNATMGGLSNFIGEIRAVGLTKLGSTIKVFFDKKIVSQTGGNGGIRRSAGSGIFGPGYAINARAFYSGALLAGICSEAIPDEQMLGLLQNPWQIFRADPVRIYSLPPVLTIPSLSNPGVIDITATSARPQVTLAY